MPELVSAINTGTCYVHAIRPLSVIAKLLQIDKQEFWKFPLRSVCIPWNLRPAKKWKFSIYMKKTCPANRKLAMSIRLWLIQFLICITVSSNQSIILFIDFISSMSLIPSGSVYMHTHVWSVQKRNFPAFRLHDIIKIMEISLHCWLEGSIEGV